MVLNKVLKIYPNPKFLYLNPHFLIVATFNSKNLDKL